MNKYYFSLIPFALDSLFKELYRHDLFDLKFFIIFMTF